MSTTNGKLVNAWILLSEDEPKGSSYDTSGSCYQTLIANNVYRSVDVLFICFVNTVPTSLTTIPPGDGATYTLEIDPASHPQSLTNADYLRFVIRDARANNPNIRIAVTLDYYNLAQQDSPTTISQIFQNDAQDPQRAAAFARNLVAFLEFHGLDGLDIDWEWPLSDNTTSAQLAMFLDAIGAAFAEKPEKNYLLTISPAVATNLDATAVNQYVNFLNLQLYSGSTFPAAFTDARINASLFAYGAKFEQPDSKTQNPQQTAQQAYDDNEQNYRYPIFTCWRLNSGNFQVEQQQQVALYQLVDAPAVPRSTPPGPVQSN
jgi:hypothetical protein